MADARQRQGARTRLREIQALQRTASTAYDRAAAAGEQAERECAAAVTRAEQARDAARRQRTVALAALAAAVRDHRTCADIAGVSLAEVRTAVRAVPAEEAESALGRRSGPGRRGRVGRGSVHGTAAAGEQSPSQPGQRRAAAADRAEPPGG